jgi:hypothetical protein
LSLSITSRQDSAAAAVHSAAVRGSIPDPIPVFLEYNLFCRHLLSSFRVTALFVFFTFSFVHFCGLVVRVPEYRSRNPGFDSRHYQIFLVVVGLVRGPPRFVTKIEVLLERKSNGSGLENRDYGRRVTPRYPRDTPSIRKSWH